MKRLIARFALFISAVSVSVEAQGQCAPDLTPPVITPGSTAIAQGSTQTVNINLPCSYIHLSPPTSPDWDPAATDFCDASLTQTLELSGATTLAETASTTLIGQTFNRGTTQVIWRFKDDRLPVPNVAFFVFTVVVVDNVPPTILCPAPLTANTSADGLGDCSTTVSLGTASPSDNCSYFPASNNAPVNFYTGLTTVTWTVYDLDSNMATCTQLVTIIDDENPVAICKDTTLYLSAAGTASVLPGEINNGSNDNCGIEFYSLNDGSFNCSDIPSSPISIILTVTDSSGRTHTCSSLITIIDDTPPVITCPADITRPNDLNLCSASVTVPLLVSTDACGVASVVNSFNIGGANASGVYPVGTTTVTYTVTDFNGNSTTCSTDIVVNDTENPDIVCPSNVIVSTDPSLCEANITIPILVSSDECGILSIINDYNSNGADASDVYPRGLTTVTYTVTDIHNNTSSCSFTITVNDNELPNAICKDTILNLDSLGLASVLPIEINNGSSDNCGIEMLSLSTSNFSCADIPSSPLGIILSVTDSSGNVQTCSSQITLIDAISPVIECPADTTLNNDPNSCDAIVSIPLLVSNDACGIVSVTNSFNANGADASDVYPVGTTTVIFTVTDNNSNSTTCSMTVTVLDDEQPDIVCPNDTTLSNDPGMCDALVALSLLINTDECGILSVVNDYNANGADASDTYPVGVTLVTFTVTDVNLNISSCSMTVTVLDDEQPDIVCPNDTTLSNDPGMCDALVSLPLLINTDECGILSVVNDYNANGADASDTYPVGVTPVTFTVTDVNLNVSTCAMLVTVLDDEQPDIVCPNDTIVSNDLAMCDAQVSLPLLINSDECGILTVVNDYNANGADASDTYPVGITTVTFTVTDINSNVSTCAMLVTVLDTELPIITCTQSDTIIVSSDSGGCSYLHIGAAWDATIATDNCDVSPVIEYQLTDVIGNPLGSGVTLDQISFSGLTNVSWTATDLYGNIGTCSFVVLVEDSIAPILTSCTSDQIVNSDPLACTYAVPDDSWDIIGTDNCGAVSYEYILSGATVDTVINSLTGVQFNLGLTTVEAILYDGAGNTDICVYNVEVSDVELPIIATCGAIIDTTVIADAGVCTFTNNGFGWDALATDNCSIDSVSYTLTGATIASGLTTLDGFEFELDTTLVTWTATDGSGNTTTCSFNVIVQDTELPVITTCGAIIDTTVVADAGVCIYTNNGFGWDALATDNCTIDSISYTLTGATVASGLTTLDGFEFELDTTLVTWTATDGSGNTTTCSFNVIVEDTELPVITVCGSIIDTTVVADAGVCTYTNNGFGLDALATDNCSIDSISYTLTGATLLNGLTTLDGITFEADTTLVTWTATDGSGNTTTCSFNVIVEDTELPVITTCGAIIDTTVVADAGVCTYTNNGLGWDALATDNCSIDSISYTLTGATVASGLTTLDGFEFELDTTLVTWTATDGSGNTTTCTFNVIVQDNELPLITCAADQTVIADAGVCTFTNNGFGWDALATDNCSIDSISYTLTGATVASGLTTLDGFEFELDTTLVTWTATDGSGNTTSCSFNVIVEDTELPIITCIADSTVSTDADVCTFTNNGIGLDATGTDNCSVTFDYVLTGATIGAGASIDGVIFNQGVTNILWTATDGSGNTATCSFNLTVNDTQVPDVLVCGAVIDTTVIAEATICTYTNIGTAWDATASDNCLVGSIVCDLTGSTTGTGLLTLDGVIFNLDSTHVLWTITDAAGNTTTCSFNVIVEDTELPIITTCGAIIDTTVIADAGVCTYTNNGFGWDALATDNCSIDSISYTLTGATIASGLTTLDGVEFELDTTLVTWTATDGSGNTATCSYNVIVTDTQAPVIAAVLPDTTVECSPVAPVAADNCGPVTGISDFTTYSGDTIVVVTWTFTDASGNTATSTQTITFDDVTSPDVPVIADAVAQCDTTVSAATTSDICMGTITGTTLDPLTYSTQGTFVINWTFDDGNGNTATATQTVIIEDVTAPSITPPATVNVYPNNAGCTATGVDLGLPTTLDNCQVTAVVNDGPTVYPLGATTVTWIVTDVAGNTTSATQTVNVLPLTSTLDTVACDVYVSPDGIDLTSFGSGTYTAVIPGSFGCDSTITINLTLNQSTTSEITLSSCDSYSAPDGQVYTNSGVFTAIIPNSQGCDSTITINLTIDSIETTGIQLNELVYSADQSNVLYQWVSCENNYAYVAGATQQTFEPQLSGDYAVILTNNTCVDTSECLTIDIDLLVPQVVTPNGDGKNDVFEIQGIYDHPNNVLEIYNRWGSLVYRQEGYQNTWGGECTEGLSFGGNILPTGTYFYILDLGDNDGAKPSKGYIFLTK